MDVSHEEDDQSCAAEKGHIMKENDLFRDQAHQTTLLILLHLTVTENVSLSEQFRFSGKNLEDKQLQSCYFHKKIQTFQLTVTNTDTVQSSMFGGCWWRKSSWSCVA